MKQQADSSFCAARKIRQSVFWKHAEIEVPADKQPLLEAWVKHFPDRIGDRWANAWPTKETADTLSGDTVHMIEVRP